MLSLAERFWAKASVQGSEDCWEWQAARSGGRYGSFRVGRTMPQAHRVSWELTFGPIPDGLLVLHRCDNPPCVNPGHLFLGTDADNAIDRSQKGRTARYNAYKTHCSNGHPFDEENTYRFGRSRQCRACNRDYKRRKAVPK